MVDLGYQLKLVPGWLIRIFPSLSRAFVFWGFRSRPTIYVPQDRVSDTPWMSLTIAHEQIHVRQWVKLGRFGFLRRYITKKGRLAAEAEAYAASVEWYYAAPNRFNPVSFDPLKEKAYSLVNMYGLRISVSQAIEAIEAWL